MDKSWMNKKKGSQESVYKGLRILSSLLQKVNLVLGKFHVHVQGVRMYIYLNQELCMIT